ncbi:MAG: T9SS type A sorting domain-containing protein, partial [bacterium]
LTINGPMFNGFLYTYAYTDTGVGLIQESGSQNDMRVRYIGQTGARMFVSPWDMPQDVWSNSPKPEEDGPVLSVRDLPGVPKVYSLSQNYPNPFNPETMIRFSIPEQGLVTLKVYNVLGEEVKTLIDKEMTSGSYEVDFNGTNLSSGIYLYTITAGNYVATKKMILLK